MAEKIGKSRNEKEDVSRMSEAIVEDNMRVYEDSVDLMMMAGLSRDECEEILFDDTNPYVYWYMDFVSGMKENGLVVDEGRTKKCKKPMFRREEDKKLTSHKYVDAMLNWKKIIYPNLVNMISDYGEGRSFDDYFGAISRVVVDDMNYRSFNTWIALVQQLGHLVDEDVQLAAMVDLNKALKLNTMSLRRKQYDKKEERDQENWWENANQEETEGSRDMLRKKMEVKNKVFGEEAKKLDHLSNDFFFGHGNMEREDYEHCRDEFKKVLQSMKKKDLDSFKYIKMAEKLFEELDSRADKQVPNIDLRIFFQDSYKADLDAAISSEEVYARETGVGCFGNVERCH